MASVEELDQVDSGMGSSDVHSPEMKSLLPDDDDDDEEVREINMLNSMENLRYIFTFAKYQNVLFRTQCEIYLQACA